MDIEQLKLILEAAAAAGDGAMRVVFVWFAYKIFGIIIHYGLFAGIFYGVYRTAQKLIKSFSFSSKVSNVTGLDLDYRASEGEVLKYLGENFRS